MAGHLRELRKGSLYELMVYAGRDPVTGKKRQRTMRFHGGERAARRALAQFATEVAKEKPSTEQTLAWAVDQWLTLQAQRGRSPTTLRTYRAYHEKWVRGTLGRKALARVTPGDIEDLLAHMTAEGKSSSTIRQVHAVLRGTLRYAKAKRWVTENAAAETPPPSAERTTVVACTPAEADLLYREAGEPGCDLGIAIALGVYSGARLGELCALRWSDLADGVIRFERSAFVVKGKEPQLKDTKTHARGEVTIARALAERLAERASYQRARADVIGCDLIADPFVLSRHSDGSGPPRPDGYTSSFGTLRDRLGLPRLHFHTLRHAVGTQLAAQGIDLVTIARLLRHRDTVMVGRTYAHGTDERSREASAALGELFQLGPPNATKPPAPTPEGTETGG